MAGKGNKLGATGGGRYAAVGGVAQGSAEAALTGSGALLESVLVALVSRGDALFIGRTRDGSALLVRVLSEEGNGEWYEGSSSGLLSTLQGIWEAATEE